jgi:hypothetical protein
MASLPACRLDEEGAKKTPMYSSGVVSGVPMAPMTSGGQDQPAHDGRPPQRDLLRDEAADGEPQHIDLTEVHGGEERDGVTGHLFHRVRCGPGGAADSGVVEGDDPPGLPGRGQRVDQRGIPAVKVAAEVLEQDQRRVTLAAGIAVRVVDAVGRADPLVRKA